MLQSHGGLDMGVRARAGTTGPSPPK
jgi:hypothetical protein